MTTKRICLGLSVAIICSAIAAAQTYTVTDLGVLGGDISSLGDAINSSGQVAGCSDMSTDAGVLCEGQSPGHAFLWGATSGMQDLGTLNASSYARAWGINDDGEIVGDSGSDAFIWTSRTGMKQLPRLPGGIGGFALAVNNSGVIVGSSTSQLGVSHAVLWSGSGQLRDLGGFVGANFAVASGINERQQVAGYSNGTDSIHFHGFLWTQTTGLRDLGTLPGGSNSLAVSINNSGVIAGYSDAASFPGGSHAVMWDARGTIHDLGTLAGSTVSWANAVNDVNQIVGGCTLPDGTNHAVLWAGQNGIRDLNDLIKKTSGWVLNVAWDINRSGLIIGYGTINGQNRAFLLTPKR
jgi:probable HAF family extracellular repeat protein